MATASDSLNSNRFAPDPQVQPRTRQPEPWSYRLKNKLLGPPLVSEQLNQEKLAKPLAYGVLAIDMISSSAYGTEEMLVIMVPVIGIAAFGMAIPVTLAILGVLFFVTLSYLGVLGYYTKAGGAYVVARDNFGPRVAQIAAVALLIDYIVTVAVQTSAGTAALTSAFPSLAPAPGHGFIWTVPITVGVTILMLYANLRGLREAGKIFAIPTYVYVSSLGLVVIIGLVKGMLGLLHAQPLPSEAKLGTPIGVPGTDVFATLGLFYLLKAFANGGASLTGLEAISNSVSAIRKPVARNARITLICMCFTLGFLVLGTSILANWTHAVPYGSGTPTVVSQEVSIVLGPKGIGLIMFYVVQFATMTILFTGGNTSFNGFPYLASFVASDGFLPRQLTKRGHRLVFSNAILILGTVAIALIVVFKAQLNALVGLYAIGVFTGFVIAGAGMTKHHLRERGRRWRLSVGINGFSATVSFAVVAILFITKFSEGAWLIALVAPPMYWGLLRLHREYKTEAAQLEVGAQAAVEGPVLRRHVMVILVDQLDMAAARTIQYARSMRPDEFRVVHFNIDGQASDQLKQTWSGLGLARLPLDIVECRDRRIGRAVHDYTADITADGETECSVLIPRRLFHSRWQRVLHDRTAEDIAAAVGTLRNVSATIVPYNLAIHESFMKRRATAAANWLVTGSNKKNVRVVDVDKVLLSRASDTVKIRDLSWRNRARIAGRIKSVRVQTAKGSAILECVITDDTADLLLVFQGRPFIPGIETGTRLIAEGMVGSWQRRLAILNPSYELIAPPD